ncbi:hypothetical protein [Winogradskyella flava]|uniref:hypothetical protein n=1 Tax=Winogradskyella flava TaxID=1884876 RepID=UPI002492C028|nr:hypothetical protein [Winogradskyella flava]
MKNFISIIILILFSINSHSQKKKFTNDLDSLFLKSGELKIGKVNAFNRYKTKNGTQSKRHEVINFCDEKNKNCVKYHLKDVEKMVKGWRKHEKRFYTKKNKKAPSYVDKFTLQFKDSLYTLADEKHIGKKYDFYKENVQLKNGYTSYILITNHDKKTIVAYFTYISDSDFRTTKAANILYERAAARCKKVDEALENKNWKDDDNYIITLLNMIDNCDLN